MSLENKLMQKPAERKAPLRKVNPCYGHHISKPLATNEEGIVYKCKNCREIYVVPFAPRNKGY